MLWHRFWGAAAALLGSAMVLGNALSLATVPDLMADERAFHAARPCAATASYDCLRTLQSTVRGTVIREQAKNSEYTLRLTGTRPVPSSLHMGDSAPLLRQLRAGDLVTVTVWRDYATAVSKHGVPQPSADTPEGEWLFATAGALAPLSVGLFVAWAGMSVLTHAPDYAALGLPASVALRGKQALGSAFCAIPAGLFGPWTGQVGVIALWAVLTGLVWTVTRRLDARSKGRHTRPLMP
ncbi:hypothetical protein E4K10_30535 [Streptomyces sp. T1317-0309]|nr:hypothetical protein E4K10_30535 [Streptomyces sp. T1317-0309]